MTPSDETPLHAGLIASRVVEALWKGRGFSSVEELGERIGMKRSTLYNRLNKGDWKFAELVAVAEELDEPISSFVDGLGGRFAATPNRKGSNRHTQELGNPMLTAA